MARVSKTNPYHARRLAEARANNEGQQQQEREEAQPEPRSNTEVQEDSDKKTETDSEPDDGEKNSLSGDEEWEVQKKRKGKSAMKKAPKRGKGGRGGPMKGVVIGLPKIPETETSPITGRRRSARKTTFATKTASYEQEEMARNSDPKGKGKAKVEETDEFEEDEACKRFTNERKMHDDRFDDDDVMPGLV